MNRVALPIVNWPKKKEIKYNFKKGKIYLGLKHETKGISC